MYLSLNTFIENQPVNKVMYLCRAHNIACQQVYMSISNRVDYAGGASK